MTKKILEVSKQKRKGGELCQYKQFTFIYNLCKDLRIEIILSTKLLDT